jgi:hypothetical protein
LSGDTLQDCCESCGTYLDAVAGLFTEGGACYQIYSKVLEEYAPELADQFDFDIGEFIR